MSKLYLVFVYVSPILIPVIVSILFRLILYKFGLTGFNLLNREFKSLTKLVVTAISSIVCILSLILSFKNFTYTIYTNLNQGLIYQSLLFSIIIISMNLSVITLVKSDVLTTKKSRLAYWCLGINKKQIAMYLSWKENTYVNNRKFKKEQL